MQDVIFKLFSGELTRWQIFALRGVIAVPTLLAGLVISGLFYWLQPEANVAKAYPYIFGSWSTVGTVDWLVLGTLAGLAIVIAMMLAGACQAAPPPIISTFEYSYRAFVALWDILFFDIAPTINSTIGMVLIVAAGLLVLHRRSEGG